MERQQSLTNLNISRPQDPLESLMHLVTSQIEKRNAILSFAESQFKHDTFYSSNTHKEASNNSNLFAKNSKHSLSLQEFKPDGGYSTKTKSNVDVLLLQLMYMLLTKM